jgi:hypothetical protein
MMTRFLLTLSALVVAFIAALAGGGSQESEQECQENVGKTQVVPEPRARRTV